MTPRPGIKNDIVYVFMMGALSNDKLEHLDGLVGDDKKSSISDPVRRALALELTIQVLGFINGEKLATRREEAKAAVESIEASSSLAEAKARAIWHEKNISDE